MWGTGPHPFMHINAVGLRRMTAKFARHHFEIFYPTPIPKFNGTALTSENHLMNKLQKQFPEISFNSDVVMKLYHKIKKFRETYQRSPSAVLYTRGDSGLGRTMAKETLLLDILKILGMETNFCCDFDCNTVEHQVSLAYYSDMVHTYFIFNYYFNLFFYV